MADINNTLLDNELADKLKHLFRDVDSGRVASFNPIDFGWKIDIMYHVEDDYHDVRFTHVSSGKSMTLPIDKVLESPRILSRLQKMKYFPPENYYYVPEYVGKKHKKESFHIAIINLE